MTANPERILEFLSKRSDLDVCKIMGVPYQLISDGESSSGTNTLKEALRYFIKFSIQPMLQSIAQSLSALAMDGTQFYYKPDRFRASDLREQGQYIKSLVGSKVLSPEQARELL